MQKGLLTFSIPSPHEQITDAGGIVIACPTLEIKATCADWIKTLPNLNTIDQAIFISANAVRCCFSQLKRHKIYWPKDVKVIAIGLGTAAALEEYGIKISALPAVPDSEHLLALNALQSVQNQRLLLVKGMGGRPLIEANLVQRGADVLTLMVYERRPPNVSHELIDSIWQNDLVDVILLTSEQSLEQLFKLFGKDALAWLHSKTYLIISDRLAKIASLLGINKIIVSHPHHIIDTLFEFYKGLTHGQEQ